MPLDGFSHVLQGADYTDAERQFLAAIEEYQRTRRRPFPAWSEVLAVLVSLGYRQVERKRPLPPTPVASARRRQL